MKEIHAFIREEDINSMKITNLTEALKTMPILSISILDSQYPESLLAIGNCILMNAKPSSAWEVELPVIVNNKYKIHRKFWMEKDPRNRVIIGKASP